MSFESFKSLSESFIETRESTIDADKRIETYNPLPFLENEAYNPDKRVDPNASRLFLEDILTVFDGLDEYTFEGNECFINDETLDQILEPFLPENWKRLSETDKKEKIINLCDYISRKLEIENPPEIGFFSEESNRCGLFSPAENKLYINESLLDDPYEMVDTLAHELRHAYQFRHALQPETKLDEMYAANFELYIRPEDDYLGYCSQLIESEASAFAFQFKSELIKLSGGNA